ncbi:MAG: hypothetical protein QM757_05085 [Paludibaculum sp.]
MDSRSALRLSLLAAVALLSACSRGNAHEYKGIVEQLEVNSGFSDFVEHQEGSVVLLDVVIPKSEFQGGSEKEFDFFDVFDTCDEVLKEGETPSAPRCQGTEYNVPKLQGRSLLVLEGNSYRLRGRFLVSKRTGPLQGLFSVQLQPVN